ncbi:hypothetical protein C1Y41_04115 [Pantoea sp. ICBG 1758]|nr:hypothetical protein C1Y41_04115 [Pantoea sp. ICBG 1758]
MIITKSNVVQGVMIQHRDQHDFAQVESMLAKIASKGAGRSLLVNIQKSLRNGRTITIKTNRQQSFSAFAMLTKYQNINPFNQNRLSTQNLVRAFGLSSIKGGRPTEGTSAVVEIDPNASLQLNRYGVPTQYKYGTQNTFLSLAHEMIHALNILQGKRLGQAFENVRDSASKKLEEEMRTVGLGKYAGRILSENSIRKEHNMPLRAAYFMQ